MSLQGTFDTLSVTELFGLLSTASKTGALRLDTGMADAGADPTGVHQAVVFVDSGLCCAVESNEVTGPAGGDEELALRLVDVGFAVARISSGSFHFVDAEAPTFASNESALLDPAIAEITTMLEQWREIEATIPSLDARIRLAPVLRSEQIVLSAPEWKLLVAIEGLPTVRDVVADQRASVIEVCRLLKDLVDRGAIEVGADLTLPESRTNGRTAPTVAPTPVPAPAAPAADADAASSTSRLDASEPYAPMASESAAATKSPVGVAAVVAEADAIAAGLVNRARSRRSAPDAFSGADGPSGDAALAALADLTADVPVAESTSAAAEASPDHDRGALLRLFSALKE